MMKKMNKQELKEFMDDDDKMLDMAAILHLNLNEEDKKVYRKNLIESTGMTEEHADEMIGDLVERGKKFK